MSLIDVIAPSNIALIKYMGKRAGAGVNLPSNGSFSLTLPNLYTRVTIDKLEGETDCWECLRESGFELLDLTLDEQNKFLNFFNVLKNEFNISGHYQVRSANNFPSDSGVASSASSFAALTLAAYKLAQTYDPKLDITAEGLSAISRMGSGSSARSFFGPACLWTKDNHISSWTDMPWTLKHEVVIVSGQKKSVSSSLAHKRIETSSLNYGRIERVEKRLKELNLAFMQKDWRLAYEVIYAEFWDMHVLFHTARPPFRYMNDMSMKVIECAESIWNKYGDGPWITMDAGANVHLIYRDDQVEMRSELRAQLKSFSMLQGIL
jgi:diphosphomevalonate decarboxylase